MNITWFVLVGVLIIGNVSHISLHERNQFYDEEILSSLCIIRIHIMLILNYLTHVLSVAHNLLLWLMITTAKS